MTTFTLSIPEPLAARIAALLENAPAERVEEAAYAFADVLEDGTDEPFMKESDPETMEIHKQRADEFRNGGPSITLEQFDARMETVLEAARQRHAEREQSHY